jgi:hypothetical protein
MTERTTIPTSRQNEKTSFAKKVETIKQVTKKSFALGSSL